MFQAHLEVSSMRRRERGREAYAKTIAVPYMYHSRSLPETPSDPQGLHYRMTALEMTPFLSLSSRGSRNLYRFHEE